MSFNPEWFDELRKIDITSLKSVPYPEGFVPNVYELTTQGVLSYNFLQITIELVKKLNHKGYNFSVHFRAYEKHITNFTKNRAFREQWNVGFKAGENPENDYARIGVGFRLGQLNEESGQKGLEEYWKFQEKVKKAPKDFDSTFEELGNYAEFGGKVIKPPLSSKIIDDDPNLHDDWRFFGIKLSYGNSADIQILNSLDRFAEKTNEIFNFISQVHFYV